MPGVRCCRHRRAENELVSHASTERQSPEVGPGHDEASAVPREVQSQLSAQDVEPLPDESGLRRVRGYSDAECSAIEDLEAKKISPRTLRAYKTDWAAWSLWCEQRQRTRLPAQAIDVAVYLAEDARRLAPPQTTAAADSPFAVSIASLDRRVAAIGKVHEAHGYPLPTRDPLVRETMDGIRSDREKGNVRRRRVQPATLPVIETMVSRRPAPGWPGTVVRRRDKALLLFGYAGALRPGELVGLAVDNVALDHDDETGKPMLRVRFGAEEQTQVALLRARPARICPVCAYAAWFELLEVDATGEFADLRKHVEGIDPEDEERLDAKHRCDRFDGDVRGVEPTRPLFPRIWNRGKIGDQPLRINAVNDLVKRYAQLAGEDPAAYGGDSLRAGTSNQSIPRGSVLDPRLWVRSRSLKAFVPVGNPLDDARRPATTASDTGMM